LVVAIVGCQVADEGSDDQGEKSGLDIQVALEALPGARVVDVDQSGIPNFISGRLGRVELKEDLAAPESKASLSGILRAIGPVFRAEPENLVLRRAHTDAQGDQHLRFTQ